MCKNGGKYFRGERNQDKPKETTEFKIEFSLLRLLQVVVPHLSNSSTNLIYFKVYGYYSG